MSPSHVWDDKDTTMQFWTSKQTNLNEPCLVLWGIPNANSFSKLETCREASICPYPACVPWGISHQPNQHVGFVPSDKCRRSDEEIGCEEVQRNGDQLWRVRGISNG
ncbi:hypothetical protein SDJN03_21815, partial [Cucurbita argyrosperma subsp. sororia]